MNAVNLTRGQNAPLPTRKLVAQVQVSAAADLSALLLTADGKVRGDQDIVFFNQQQGPGVRCVPPSGGSPWKLELDLDQVPTQIEKVRVVTSLDEAGRTFGSLPGAPVAQVTDAGGAPVATAELSGLSTESIVIALEFYRRGGDWKIRSVGQGYSGGLADLLRDHGVDVADEPASAAPAQPAAPPVQPPAPPATPAQQQRPPQHDPYSNAPYPGAPTQPPAQHNAPTMATPVQDPYATAPPPPAQPSAAASAPPAHDPYAAAAPQHTPAPAAPQSNEPALTRGRPVNLSKGQSVNLRKDDGQSLTGVRMGLGWDPVSRGGLLSRRTAEIDLDASAIMLAGSDIVDVVFYNRLASADGSVQHSGDNRTGEGDGDDESVRIDLSRVPVHVTSIVLVVTSYEGHTFQMVQNAFCRLIDEAGRGGELVRYQLAGGAASTGMAMAALRRTPGGWRMQAIGEPLQARTPHETFGQMPRFAQ
ncbi:TerD family protein [Yimella sp. cx-51]|nr:TerD family protein [Yimella sp. cx-51]MBC9955694.1 TerD family protein [Yimella sp. cx-51]QTH37737.1 TerD family protein [Yimella sp. cx-51]